MENIFAFLAFSATDFIFVVFGLDCFFRRKRFSPLGFSIPFFLLLFVRPPFFHKLSVLWGAGTRASAASSSVRVDLALYEPSPCFPDLTPFWPFSSAARCLNRAYVECPGIFLFFMAICQARFFSPEWWAGNRLRVVVLSFNTGQLLCAESVPPAFLSVLSFKTCFTFTLPHLGLDFTRIYFRPDSWIFWPFTF